MDSTKPNAERGGLLSRVPVWVWIVALLAGTVHMLPYWRAQAVTPTGWTYTANMSISPDYMQYRVWSRQTLEEGPIVSNRFTAEPNRPHLPVFPYWVVGRTADLLGATPEWTYAWMGAALTFAFTVLLYLVVRRFMPTARATAWVFFALLLGGGLGGYLMLMRDAAWVRGNYLLGQLFIVPFMGEGRTALFESYRGNYIVQSIFDTHFMLFWLLSTVAVVALWTTLRRFTWPRLALTMALFALGTLFHVYEGLTLLVIAFGACVAMWRKDVPLRTAATVFVACGIAVGAVLVPLAAVYKSSGLQPPEWRGLVVDFPIVVLAYPLAWLLIVPGIARYWREANTDRAFLVGWATALLLLTLSGPFFPYPDRGTMTLQIPLMLIAGGIWFARHERVGVVGGMVALLLLGSTPFLMADNMPGRTVFTEDQPHKWLGPSHRTVMDSLGAHAQPGDVLVADQPPLRWLAPDYPGVHYAGHFFLTVDFANKRQALDQFWTDSPDAQAAFLREQEARWLFVDAEHDPARFEAVPGLRPVVREQVGTLFEFSPHAEAQSQGGAESDTGML